MDQATPPIINPNSQAISGINPTDLMSEIQNRLLGSSSAITSGSSKIEDTITGAIDKLNSSNESSKAAVGSAYDREIATKKDAAALAESSYQEAQRGYATNTAALKDLRTSNEKSIRDLDQRKQEALLGADAETANKVSGLILQKYEFEQQATQQVFSNLISLNNSMLQSKQEQRLAQTQEFDQEQTVQNIALKYGIDVPAGTSLSDVVKLAKPYASREEKLQLDQAEANIKLTNQQIKTSAAQATAALKDSKATTPLDAQSVGVIAQNLKDNGSTATAIKAQLATSAGITDKAAAYKIVDDLFAAPAKKATSDNFSGNLGSGLLNDAAKIGSNLTGIRDGVLQYIFGEFPKAK